jgi:hypothetical protein
MDTSKEAACVAALDSAIVDLAALRPLLLLALARDDAPSDGYSKDPVHKACERVVKNVFAISRGSANTLRFSQNVAGPAVPVEGRIVELPDCLINVPEPHMALPRPRRGLCGSHYDGFRRGNYTDLSEYIRDLIEAAASPVVPAGAPVR